MLVFGTCLFLKTVKLNRWKGWLALSSLMVLVVTIWGSQPFSPPLPWSEAIPIVGLIMILLPMWGIRIERQSTQL